MQKGLTPVLLTVAQLVGANVGECQSISVDRFDPGANDVVYACSVQLDGKTLVGGRFTQFGGQARAGIARLNADGTLDVDFDPGTALGATIGAISIQGDGKILAGGNFNKIGGQDRAFFVRLMNSGELDFAFDPQVNGWVDTVSPLPDGAILITGLFTKVGSQPCGHIAQLSVDGTLAENFNGGGDIWIGPSAVQNDGAIIVGGSFTQLAGMPQLRLGHFGQNHSLDQTFDPRPDYNVTTVAAQPDGKFVVGGFFTNIASNVQKHLARLNPDGTLDKKFSPIIEGGSVVSVALRENGKIVIGGSFTNVNGVTRKCLACLNGDGSLDTDFDIEADAAVTCLALQPDGKVLVGGYFSSLGGQPRNHIGRLSLDSPDEIAETIDYDGEVVTWIPPRSGPAFSRVTLEYSEDGVSWAAIGNTIYSDHLWKSGSIALPSTGKVRSRGYYSGGFLNGAGLTVESFLAAPWPIHASILTENADLRINWTGGIGPFQLQQSAEIGNPNAWLNLGDPMQTNSASVPIGTGNLFLRVRGQ